MPKVKIPGKAVKAMKAKAKAKPKKKTMAEINAMVARNNAKSKAKPIKKNPYVDKEKKLRGKLTELEQTHGIDKAYRSIKTDFMSGYGTSRMEKHPLMDMPSDKWEFMPRYGGGPRSMYYKHPTDGWRLA